MLGKEYRHGRLWSISKMIITFMHNSPQAQLRLAHGLKGRSQARLGPTLPTLLIYQNAVNKNKNIFHRSRKLLEIPTNRNIGRWHHFETCRILDTTHLKRLRVLHLLRNQRHRSGHLILLLVSQTIDKDTITLTIPQLLLHTLR